jgi:thiol:disulfide interchange protein
VTGGADAGRPGHAGSTRRDPAWLLIAAGVLLALRVILGVHEASRPASSGAAPLSETDLVHWRALEAGLAEARATDRPLLYDFTAGWCPPCRMMQRQVFADPRAAAELESRFVPVRVLDRQREEGRNARWVDSLQSVYHVNAFPTLVVAGADGREALRLEGFVGRDVTLGRLRGSGVSVRWGAKGPEPAGPR